MCDVGMHMDRVVGRVVLGNAGRQSRTRVKIFRLAQNIFFCSCLYLLAMLPLMALMETRYPRFATWPMRSPAHMYVDDGVPSVESWNRLSLLIALMILFC